MKKERSNIQLSSYDDIFGSDASADKAGAVNGDTVVDIPLDAFKVLFETFLEACHTDKFAFDILQNLCGFVRLNFMGIVDVFFSNLFSITGVL